jgi:hypothetical protein
VFSIFEDLGQRRFRNILYLSFLCALQSVFHVQSMGSTEEAPELWALKNRLYEVVAKS